MELESNGFKEFVYWVLLNKTLDLDSFRLWCADYYDMSTIRRWIHAAVVRKIKLLDLMFGPIDEPEDLEIPHCLVTCSSLEVLKLYLLGYHRLCLPKIPGFPALRVLELNDVVLSDIYKRKGDLVNYFLESCPLLEDLSLLNCCTPSGSLVIASPKLKNLRIEKHEIIPDPEVDDMLDCLRLKISCPNLELLKLVGPVSFKFSFRDLHSLKKSMIHCTDFSSESFCDVFNGISHVEYLSISICFIGQCYWPDEDEEPMSLPNLKTLEITVDDPQGLYMIITFLEYFPDLESLHLIFIKHVYGLNKWHLQEAEKINILTRRLKKVEFCEFDDEKPILVVARALLEHGKELEEMVFSWGDEAKFHEMSSETMNQVSNFRKVSSTVKLRFVINPSQADP